MLFNDKFVVTKRLYYCFTLVFDPPRHVESNYQRAMANLRTIAIEKRKLQLLGLYPIVVSTDGMRSEDLNANDYYDYYGDYLTSDYQFEREYDERMYEILQRSSKLHEPTTKVGRKKIAKPKKIKEMYITSKAKSFSKKNNAYRVKGVGDVYLQNKPVDYSEQIEKVIRRVEQNEPTTNRRFDLDINKYDIVDEAQENDNPQDPKTVLTASPKESSLPIAPMIEKIMDFISSKSNKLDEKATVINPNSQHLFKQPSTPKKILKSSNDKWTENDTFYDYSGESDEHESAEIDMQTISSSTIISKEPIIKVDTQQFETTSQTSSIYTTENSTQLPSTIQLTLPVDGPFIETTTERRFIDSKPNEKETLTKESASSFIINELQSPTDKDHVDSFFDDELTTNATIKPTPNPNISTNSTHKNVSGIENHPDGIVFIDDEKPFILDFQNYQTYFLDIDAHISPELSSGGSKDGIRETTTVINGEEFEYQTLGTSNSQTDRSETMTMATVEDSTTVYIPVVYDLGIESVTSTEVAIFEDISTPQASTEIFYTTTSKTEENTIYPDSYFEQNQDIGLSNSNSNQSTDFLFYTTEHGLSISQQETVSDLTRNDSEDDKEVGKILSKIGRYVLEAQNSQLITILDDAVIQTTTTAPDETRIISESLLSNYSEVNLTNNFSSSTDDNVRINSDQQEEDHTFTEDVKQQIDDISLRISDIIGNAVQDDEGVNPLELKKLKPTLISNTVQQSLQYQDENEPPIEKSSSKQSDDSLNHTTELDGAIEMTTQLYEIQTETIVTTEPKAIAVEMPVPEPAARNLADNTVDEPSFRRSDVLVESEYSNYDRDDQTDDEDQLITVDEMTQLNQLKLIPLIPVLIEQLRLGRVSADEIEILQQIFGAEFWQLILSEVQSNTSLAEMNATLAKIMREKQQSTATEMASEAEPLVILPGSTRRKKRSPTFRRLRNERRRQRLLVRRLQLEASRLQTNGRWNNNDGLTVNIGLNDPYGVSRRQPIYLDY